MKRIGKEAKNWTVVTSDREILAEARSMHSKILSSSDFAGLLARKEASLGEDADSGEKPEVSGEEVDYWLDQFNQD